VNTFFNRRELLGVAVASAACSRPLARQGRAPAELPKVSIVRQEAYTQDVYDAMRRLLAEHQTLIRGKRVVLKPNLVEFDPHRPVNTHPILVHAALEAFKALGAADVRIAEGPGHRRATMDMADGAGYFETIPKFEDIFTDLNLDDVSLIGLRNPHSTLKELYLPNTILAADLLVSMPKLKTHHWTGATLSMKNLFGVVPGGVYGWPKNVLHWAGIHECVADLANLFPRTLAIVDGIVGMEGNGPIQGSAKPVGLIVAGTDLAAVDATCCRLMGINPLNVGYLALSRSSDALAAAAIRQTGEAIAGTRALFELPPRFEALRGA
jgi:uncharacterized protein (DUF362 family)